MIDVNVYKLPNGLTLLHHYDCSTRMVCVNLLYDVGSRDENQSCTGLAHLMEHLMFTGSRYAPDFDGALQAAGGESNAWTSADMTNYYETLPAQNLETALWLESGRLLGLNLNDQGVSVQKKVVVEEFKQRCLNQPYGDLSHCVNSVAYTVHPYRWPVIGLSPDDIERASHREIVDFFHSHYAVNNLILCISGHVALDRAVDLVVKWFGDIEPVQLPKRELPQEPAHTARRCAHFRRDVPDDMVYLVFNMCGRTERDYVACDQLSDILSNGTSSRLYQNVLLKTGMFTDLDASVTGTIDPGLFLLRGRLSKGVKFDRALAAIEQELQRLVDDGVTQYEHEKATNKYESNFLFENIGYAEKAVKLCQYELLGKNSRELDYNADSVNTEVGRYHNLDRSRLQQVASQLFRPENSSVIFYGPNA